MKVVEQRFVTQRSVREVAGWFQDAAHESRGFGSKFSGTVARATGYGGELEFFTPRDDSPFSGLDDDPEDFCVGVHIPKGYGGGRGATRTVQMAIWDRGSAREVVVVSPYGMGEGSGARKLVDSFLATFARFDPAIRLPGAAGQGLNDDVAAGQTDNRLGAGETPQDAPLPPADWYPDPTGSARLRYWNGSAWTEHTAT